MYLLIGALHAIPVFIVGHYSCNRFAIIGAALLCAALGFATGNPAYIGIDLVCVIGATIAVLEGTAHQRKVLADRKKAIREAEEAARRAERAVTSNKGGAGAIVAAGAGLVILLALSVSNRQPRSAPEAATTPFPMSESSSPVRATSVSSEAAAHYAPTPKEAARREEAESDAEEKWNQMLAEEDADRQRRFDELNRSLPQTFERTIAECSLRADEIEAWVCSERFLDRLRGKGIPISQAALDGLLWPEPPNVTASVASEPRPAPNQVHASLKSPPVTLFITPDTRRTRHTGQRLGEAPRAITDPNDCLTLLDKDVKAACARHFH
jgi:hypothetical protein